MCAEEQDIDCPVEELRQEADECEGMDTLEPVTPVKEQLNMPEKDTTDMETGEAASLMKTVLLTKEREPSQRSRRSDQQSTVVSDDNRRAQGYSSDSSILSCRSTGSKASKHHRDHKEAVRPETKPSEQLEVPESTTPRQSPQQKQIRMIDSGGCPATPAPMVRSAIGLPEMPPQDCIHARLNKMKKKMEGLSGESALLLSQE